jgi:hypothetical protein
MAIYLEQEYKEYLKLAGVGKNDKVADSIESYVDYLNCASKNLRIDIDFRTAGTSPKVKQMVYTLGYLLARKEIDISARTIDNIRSALNQYKEFAIDYQINND